MELRHLAAVKLEPFSWWLQSLFNGSRGGRISGFLKACMAEGALGYVLKSRMSRSRTGRQILRLAIHRQVNVSSGGVAFAG
jgi:hypothetical protein